MKIAPKIAGKIACVNGLLDYGGSVAPCLPINLCSHETKHKLTHELWRVLLSFSFSYHGWLHNNWGDQDLQVSSFSCQLNPKRSCLWHVVHKNEFLILQQLKHEKCMLKTGSQHCLHTFDKTSSSWTLDALSDFENLTFFLLPFFYKDDTVYCHVTKFDPCQKLKETNFFYLLYFCTVNFMLLWFIISGFFYKYFWMLAHWILFTLTVFASITDFRAEYGLIQHHDWNRHNR